MRTMGTFLVSGDFDENGKGVLIVGTKRENETLQIINAFQGEEAFSLFQKISENRYQKAVDKQIDAIYEPIDDVLARLSLPGENIKQW